MTVLHHQEQINLLEGLKTKLNAFKGKLEKIAEEVRKMEDRKRTLEASNLALDHRKSELEQRIQGLDAEHKRKMEEREIESLNHHAALKVEVEGVQGIIIDCEKIVGSVNGEHLPEEASAQAMTAAATESGTEGDSAKQPVTAQPVAPVEAGNAEPAIPPEQTA